MRILQLIASTVAAVLVAAAGSAPAGADAVRGADLPGERIINGHAPTQAWPAQTSVQFTTTTSPGVTTGTYVCGGTLVSARWVLTAAHCATNDDSSALTAGAFALRVGSTSRTSLGHTPAVDAVRRHPDYSDSGSPVNDVALLHLATAVPQEPLQIVGAAETGLWSAGVGATIIGWGVTESGSTSATLLEAQVTMTSDSSCLSRWGLSFDALSMVCAGGAATDTCSGDSGGPLMVPRDGAFALAGVTSWGTYPCGDPDYPGVYARVGAPAISSWLDDYVPTVGVAVSPAVPEPGEQATLTATISAGAQTAPPDLAWDLDDDGAFDDATGSIANATFPEAGTSSVRLQATYPDGDRAVARKAVSVGAPAPVTTNPPAVTPPPEPIPAPVPVPAIAPALQPSPQPIQELQQPPTSKEPLGSVSAPSRMKLRTLRSKGMRVRITCERACTIAGRLRHGDATVGRAGGSLDAGKTRTVVVRLDALAKRALRGRKRLTLRLTTQLTSGTDSLQRTRRVIAGS